MKVTGLFLTCLWAAASLPAEAAPEKPPLIPLSLGSAPESFLSDTPFAKTVDPFGTPYVLHGSGVTKVSPRVRNSYPRLDFPGPGYRRFLEPEQEILRH